MKNRKNRSAIGSWSDVLRMSLYLIACLIVLYAIPKEGTNLWVDAMVILKGTKHRAEAEEFINYMTRPDVARKNVEYIGYASPIPEVVEKLSEDVRKNIAAYPDDALLKDAEVFNDLMENMPKYDKVWTEVKVAQ